MEEYDHNDKIGQPRTRTAMRRLRRTQARGDFLPSPPRFGDRPGVPGGPSRSGGVLPQNFSLIGLYLRDPCPNAHQDRVCPVKLSAVVKFALRAATTSTPVVDTD